MSCFIVKKESIFKIVKGLEVLISNPNLKKEVEKILYVTDPLIGYTTNKDIFNVRCNKLIKLNYMAYGLRYKQDMQEELKVEINFTNLTLNNPLNLIMPATIYQYVKTLECFLYQCDQGDISNNELYKALKNLMIKIKCWIFDKSQSYKNAEWE